MFEDVRLVQSGFMMAVDSYLGQLDRLQLSRDFGVKGRGFGLLRVVSPHLRYLTFAAGWEYATGQNNIKIRSGIRSLLTRCRGSLTSIQNILIDEEDVEVLVECKKLTRLVPSPIKNWDRISYISLSRLWCGLELKECRFPVVEPFLWLIKNYPPVMKRPTSRLIIGQLFDIVKERLFDIDHWPGLQECSICIDGCGLDYTREKISTQYSSTLTSLSLYFVFEHTDTPYKSFHLDLPILEHLTLEDWSSGGSEGNHAADWRVPSLKSLSCRWSVDQVSILMQRSVHINSLTWLSIPEIPASEVVPFIAPSLRTVVISQLRWNQQVALSWFPSTITHLDITFADCHGVPVSDDGRYLMNLIGKFTGLKHLSVSSKGIDHAIEHPHCYRRTGVMVERIQYPFLETLSLVSCPSFIPTLLDSIHAPQLTRLRVKYPMPRFQGPVLIDGLLDCIHHSPRLIMIDLCYVSDMRTEFPIIPLTIFPPLLYLTKLNCTRVTSFTYRVLQTHAPSLTSQPINMFNCYYYTDPF